MNYKFFPNFATNISNNSTIIIFSGWNKFLRKLHFVILFVKICICKNTRSPTILSETRTILKILDDCQETQISDIFWARKSFKSSSTIRPFERKKEGSNKVAMRSQIFPANTNFPCYFWNIVRSEKMKRERFEAIWRDWPSRILFSSACCIESISSSFIISSILQGSRRFLKTWPGHNSTTKDGSLFFFTSGTSCCLVQGELLFRRNLQAVRKKDILWVKYRNKMQFVWKNIKQ